MQHLRALASFPSLLAGLVVLAALSACGGGGGGGPAAPTLVSPSTGAVWGGTHMITWTGASADGGSAQVLLSTDGGANFGTVLASSTPDDGSFTLDTTTQTDGEEFRVRVVLASGTVLTSGDFAIDNTAPVTTLTAPIGTEILGATPTVTWTTTDAHPGTVELRLSSDGGANYDVVVAAAATDNGVYVWSASALADGTQYRLQVIATDRAANEGLPSRSPQSFELDNTPPVITLTSPNGAESWSGTHAITWSTTETNLGTVQLMLSTDSGANFTSTIAATAPDTGTYAWQTGEAVDGTTLRVRAIATDMAGNASAPDASDADFTITNLRISGPVHFLDLNQSGAIDAGDQLYLKFDKNVTVNSAVAADLALGTTLDTLGTGATVGAGPELDSVVVTLGTNPTLRTRGVFSTSATAQGRPSGIDISGSLNANAIEHTGTGLDAVPSGYKDLRPSVVAMSVGITTAGSASAGAAGDLDGDGDLDLVLAESTGVGTHILLGNGAGGFVSNGTLGTVAATDVVLGDVDGDGHLDQVIAAGAGARVALGNGAGGFAAYGAAIGTGVTTAVALADFDCDGDLDLYLGNAGSGANLVFFNDGAGVFSNSGQALGTGNTVALAVGDVDRDGDLDVVAAAMAGGQPVRVWLNNGAGVFSVGDAITTTAAQDVALGDLDGDGDLDVAIAVNGQNEIRMNDGTGTFGATFQYFGNNDNRGVALVDLDGDGDLDVITVKDLDAERWWYNDGAGQVTESSARGLADNARAVVVGRLDGDSDVDLFVVVDGAVHRTYFASVSGGQPEAELEISAGATIPLLASRQGLVGDFDGDGIPDVALSVIGGSPRVLFHDGQGTFAAGAAFGSSGMVLARAGDIDCDGDLDLIADNPLSPNNYGVWWNNGAGVFTAGPTGLPAPISELVDADRDGDLDYVAVDSLGEPQLWFGNGAGAFVDSGAVLWAGPATQGAIVDLDGDGVLDVFTAGTTTFVLSVGAGDGVTDSTMIVNPTAAEAFLLLDTDRDGDLDVLGYNGTGGELDHYRNDLPGSLTTLAPTNTGVEHDGVQLFDWNEDGALDVFMWSTSNGFTVEFLLGDGAGGFTSGGTGPMPDMAQALFADFDLDGDTDGYIVLYDEVGPAAVQHVYAVFD